MSGTVSLTGRRVALTVAWHRRPRRTPEPPVIISDPATPPAQAGMPATLPTVEEKMSFEERARAGGQGRAAALTPDARAESARTAANAAHRPAALARRIARAWPALDRAGRKEVREILRDAKIID